MSGGHCGQILKVNLSTGTITKEPLPSGEVLRKYIGGAGLGLYYLAQSLKPGVRALDPENTLVLMTGPLTGTRMPNASDWVVVTLNAQIRYAPCVSHAHGFFGARMKHAGYDGIVIQGASPRPVFLLVDDDKVELRDAEKYWGMDTYETPQTLQSDLGLAKDQNTSIACIGPAGEQMLRGGVVRCDLAYTAAKGGPGAVWGSKKLKAVVIRGTRPVQVHDPESFALAADALRAQAEGVLHSAHVIKSQLAIAEEGAMACKNFKEMEWQCSTWARRWREDTPKWKVTPVGSWECVINCHHDTTITTGPHAGARVMGYGAGVVEEAACIIGVEDPGTSLFMSGFYDAMGCDPSEEGRLIAMAFELYNEGLLTEEQTGGLRLEWGNAEAARDLFMQILMREKPLGAILAKGYVEAVKELPSMEGRFMHIKGAGFMHDQRGYGLGILFQSIVSGAGPTWQGFGVEKFSQPDLGYLEVMDKKAIDGKAEACFKTQCLKMVEDSVGLCWFALVFQNVPGITRIVSDALVAATGWDYSWSKQGQECGHRIINLQRLIALSRGFTKADDFDVAERVLEDPGKGPAAGRRLGPHLARMIDEYYGLCGWDIETGAPTPETLERLGMSSLAEALL